MPHTTPQRVQSFFDYPEGEGGSADLVFLADRSADDWERLLARMETRSVRAGEIVLRAGEIDRALYVLAKGRLEVLLAAPGGGLRPIATIDGGSVVGEVAFLDGGPRSATIRAVTDCELMRLGFEEFEVLGAHYPELGRAILIDLGRILAVRLRQMNEVVVRLSS